ncbi:MAG: hypothetical protein WC901_03775 [Candidatus Margulisiibacteriota bacterium]
MGVACAPKSGGSLARPRVSGFTIDPSPHYVREQATWVNKLGGRGYELIVCVPDVTVEMFSAIRCPQLPSYSVPQWRAMRELSLDPGKSLAVVAARILINSRGRLLGVVPCEAMLTSEVALTPSLAQQSMWESQNPFRDNLLQSADLAWQLISWQRGTHQRQGRWQASLSVVPHPNRIVNEFIAATNQMLSQWINNQGGAIFFTLQGGLWRTGHFTAPLQKKESICFQIVLKMLMRGYTIDQILRFFSQEAVPVPFPENYRHRTSNGPFPQAPALAEVNPIAVGSALRRFIATHPQLKLEKFEVTLNQSAAYGTFRARVFVALHNRTLWYGGFGQTKEEAMGIAAQRMLEYLMGREALQAKKQHCRRGRRG